MIIGNKWPSGGVILLGKPRQVKAASAHWSTHGEWNCWLLDLELLPIPKTRSVYCETDGVAWWGQGKAGAIKFQMLFSPSLPPCSPSGLNMISISLSTQGCERMCSFPRSNLIFSSQQILMGACCKPSLRGMLTHTFRPWATPEKNFSSPWWPS